jgi:hypothetical protein
VSKTEKFKINAILQKRLTGGSEKNSGENGFGFGVEMTE